MLTVDLNVRFIEDHQKIWLVHPGRGRRFFEVFRQEAKVFLELPGLMLSERALSSVGMVRQHLRMAEAWRKYYSQDDIESVPSRDPSSFPDEPGDEKAFHSSVGNIISLFSKAKDGDLVVVCGYGQYEPILFGEFVGEFNPEHKLRLEGTLGYEDINYRKVEWLSTSYTRRDLPATLSKYVVNRHAVAELERTAITEQLYRYAYKSYAIGNIAKIDIFGPKYTGKKLFETYTSERLIAYLISAFIAIERGDRGSIANLSVNQLISKYPSAGLIDGFDQDFHSPGKQTLFSRRGALALFVSGGIGIATIAVSGADFADKMASYSGGVEVKNSAGGQNQQLTEDVRSGLDYFVKSLGENKERAKEFREVGEQAAEVMGTNTSSSVNF